MKDSIFKDIKKAPIKGAFCLFVRIKTLLVITMFFRLLYF